MGVGYLAWAHYTQSIRGVVLDVQASSLVFADQISVRDANGEVWIFTVDREVSTNNEEPQSASHLRRLMVAADPVTVRYRRSGGAQMAVRILDGEHP